MQTRGYPVNPESQSSYITGDSIPGAIQKGNLRWILQMLIPQIHIKSQKGHSETLHTREMVSSGGDTPVVGIQSASGILKQFRIFQSQTQGTCFRLVPAKLENIRSGSRH